MTDARPFPQLDIPDAIAAGPGPGNTDTHVLARYAGASDAGIANLDYYNAAFVAE